MNGSPAEWHARFEKQAQWTAPLRSYLFSRINLTAGARILEAGSGTGAITQSLYGYAHHSFFGIDLNLPSLRFARLQDPRTVVSAADAHDLPFPSNTFDAVMCHFLLLWVAQPARVLSEMARVCRPGGAVMALAEPDYAGRVDFPPPLIEAGRLQADALRSQGADPEAGRKLSGWMHTVGLLAVETGVLGGQWTGPPEEEAWLSEWDTLENDLKGSMPREKLAELKSIDREAWQDGSRVLFVPTFFGFGIKP